MAASSSKVYLPEYIKAEIRKIWKWEPPDHSYAAKQAVCWAADRLYSHDQNAIVDTAISAGRLAERCNTADEFIAEFEEKILNIHEPRRDC